MDVILHIGAGQGEQLEDWLASEARRIVLFEPHPGLAKRLTHASEGQPRVSVVPVAIATEAGGCSLQEYNLPEANSLRAPTALKQLFPGLKKVNHYPVQAITPDQMMAEYGPADNEAASLVIEAPGEAHAILQPLVEHDLLDRFVELQVSMTVEPCYDGSASADQTLESLRDYGFDVISHDDRDPDWPYWVLHRNPLKVELKKLQHRLNRAEEEKAAAKQHTHKLEKQLADQKQAHEGDRDSARQESEGLKKQVAEQRQKWKKLEQQHKKQKLALEKAEENFKKTHTYFLNRKKQALELEDKLKRLRKEHQALETMFQEQKAALEKREAEVEHLQAEQVKLQAAHAALQESLKLPAPQPSTELLFSAHTEPMVRALKGEEGQQGGESEAAAKQTPAESVAESKPETTPEAQTSVASKPPAVAEKNKLKKAPKDFKAISIMDEISEECWKHEFNSFRIDRKNYKNQVGHSTATFAFLESCWKGNGGAWEYAFTSPGLKHANAQALLDLIPRLKKRKMPVVFWNKEDPMHYDRYLPIAKQADVIFTTDSNKVPDYQRDVPEADVYAVPFAAQQKICNPSDRFRTEPESVCFAGSYYSVGHDERKRQMHALLPSIIEFKGAIYDRFSKLGNDRYKFPDQFQPFIRDAVPFNEVVKLYKQFKVFLNVNTIVDSPTMMSRRVYELLACGTPVVSTPSKAIEEQFPGIVHMANDAQEANKIIEKLLTDEHYWEKTSHLGYREVMTKHTYTHRLQSIKQALGYDAGENKPLVSIITCTRRPNMIDRIVENMTRQNHPNCELILMLQDFTDAQRNELVDKLKSKPSNLKRIEVIVNDSQDITLGERFNHAATHAKGEYIAKMDDDDFYFEHYLSDMLIPFTFGDYGMVGKKELFMYLSGSNKLVKRFPGMKHRIVDFVAGPTFVVKKKVFDQVKFESRNTGEDSTFIKNIQASGYKIYAADPFNFIQFRADPSKHTWGVSDEDILSGKQTQVVADHLDTSVCDF